MNPGYYRDYVTVQTESTVVGSDYQHTTTYADGDSFWARIELDSGFEITDDLVLQGESQFTIKCEFNPIAAAIKTSDRLKIGTRDDLILRVSSPPTDPKGDRKHLEFSAKRLEHDS